ncbi:MAG: SDR family NAD(P)-dependent oxidoreductase [Anaerolineae bacterium]|nr:SDR family NAD(P)-dependent oxidoreductase [Anaerolineae bacterium]
MKVLVTGGAGFIGSHVADAYVAEGYEVVVVDNLSTGRKENLNPAASLYQVDIRDEKALAEVFEKEKPDYVSHQAARAQVRESMDNPVLYAEVNIIGSLNVLQLCRQYKVKKTVYASTGGAVYGEPEYLPADEGHPVNPLDPYGASKHHVEHYLYLYKVNWGLPYTILRYPNVYGPRQDPYGEAGVVAIFTGQMLSDGQPIINGAGEQERDFVYVGDIAQANLLAIGRGDGEIFNIGTGVGTSINTVFRLLKKATGYSGEEIHASAKAGEVFKIYLDASKARNELGWAERVTLEEGLSRTVEYFRSNSGG